MKKLSLAIFTLCILLSSCKSGTFDSIQQNSFDDQAIQLYIKANNIPAIKDPSGIYYQIITQGTGFQPTATSTVQVNYIGKLLDGTIFDQTTASTGSKTLALSSTVQGWQLGLPFLKAKGGRILLIIPSSLGYGATVSGAVPANSVLVFTIDLLAVTSN